MITKRDYANYIVNKFIDDNWSELKDHESFRKDIHTHIYASSSLCVALEYLGELSPEDMAYASTRAGTAIAVHDPNTQELRILSTRELMSLLPEEL